MKYVYVLSKYQFKIYWMLKLRITQKTKPILWHLFKGVLSRNIRSMLYSRARLICMANARKNRVNYPSMWIIRAYFTLHFNQRSRVVYWTTMQIIRGVRISEGQIMRAILYLCSSRLGKVNVNACKRIRTL